MGKEIIEKIYESDGFKIKESDWESYDGFIIKTNLQEIKLGISNGQCCCEDWGYFISEDEDSFKSFIGSEVLNITTTDTALNTEDFNKNMEDIYMEDCSVMFVNIETSAGTLQFTAYNSHNGYYGHDAIVHSKSLTLSEGL